MTVYSSLRDFAVAFDKKLTDRIVLYMRPPMGFTVESVGNTERALVPLDGLDVFFAEFCGIGRRHRRRHSRSYKLRQYAHEGRICWGGPDRQGTVSYRFLDKTERDNSITERFRELLSDEKAQVATPLRAEAAMPKAVAQVTTHTTVEWSQPAMELYIRQLFMDEILRIEQGEGSEDGLAPTEGLVIDFSDWGIDHVILPEHVGADGRFGFSGDLSSVQRIKESLGKEVFNKLVLHVWKILCRTGIVPLNLIHPDSWDRLDGHIYWDMSDYMRLSKETVGADRRFEWFVVVAYEALTSLRFQTDSEVFDFSSNYERNRLDDVLKSRIEQARKARQAAENAQGVPEGEGKTEK